MNLEDRIKKYIEELNEEIENTHIHIIENVYETIVDDLERILYKNKKEM